VSICGFRSLLQPQLPDSGSSLFALFEFFAVTHSVEASAVGRKMGGTKMNAFFKGQDGPRMARMKPWLLIPSVKSVSSVVKIFLPPSFCRRPRLMIRVAKPGVRNRAARRIRTIAPAGNGGAAGENGKDKEGPNGELSRLRSLLADYLICLVNHIGLRAKKVLILS